MRHNSSRSATADAPGAIPASVRADILARLDAIEAEEDVQLLLALESGSRAWGFPSPDSDYDVRFVYVRKRDWYLGLAPGRDVIETPIVDEIDLNGWDIRKALTLLLKANATINEWMQSPIRYRADHPVMADLAQLADELLDTHALAQHYASVGRKAVRRWLGQDAPVRAKGYFYALRPAMVIRYLRQNPGMRPPMNLQQLIAATDLPVPLVEEIERLVAAKSRANEGAPIARLAGLDELIADELGRASGLPRRQRPGREARAEAIFLQLVNA